MSNGETAENRCWCICSDLSLAAKQKIDLHVRLPRRNNGLQTTKLVNQTIYTVAEALSLSPSTISKALAGSHEVSEPIRAKVIQYCTRVGFKRRRFTPSRVNLCAVVQRNSHTSRWLTGFVNELIEGIANYTSQNKLEFSLFGDEQNALDRVNLARELKRRHVDGAIILNALGNCAYINNLAEANFPFRCIQGDDGKHSKKVIRLENEKFNAEAVRVLSQLGHREICLLSAGPSLGASVERRRGFLDAMREWVGVDARHLIVDGHPEKYDPVSVGYHCGLEILGWRRRPTAVISEGLKPPIGFVRACHERNIRIPQDISLLSIGTNSELEMLVPAISAIPVPTRELGEIAARHLHGELLGEAVIPEPKFPQPRVVMRESVVALTASAS